MGLLNTIDRFLPDEQVMGLLRGGGRMLGLGGGQGAPAPTAQPQQARAARQGPGFGRLLEELILNGQGFGETRDEWRDKQANTPLLDLQRRLAMETGNRQMAGYGAADRMNMTPQEMVALGFNPKELGASLAKGSEPYTLGRNDQRYGRGDQPVTANTTPSDPQVVGAGASLVAPSGEVVYRAPQYQSVGADSRLVETTPGIGRPAGAPPLTGGPAQVVAALTAMGARMTSGRRSAADNTRVGGVANSDHLTGQAADLVPPPGMTMAQLAAEARERVPGSEVIEEGDHVHVEWGKGAHSARAAPGGPRVVVDADPRAQNTTRPATAEEKAAYGIAADVPAKIDAKGDIQVISGTGAANKRVPPKIASGYTANKSAVTQIDRAIASIKANKDALGFKNYLGDDVQQRFDPKGVGVRADVANIGSLKRHDRSGATVTAAESPILKPFIPSVTDTADAAITKLERLKQEYQNANAEIDVEFGEESGYAPMGGMGRQPPPANAPPAAKPPPAPKTAGGRLSPAEAAKLPKGAKFIGLDGKERTRL